METTWWEYVQRITRNATGREIADKVGIDASHVSRWKKGFNPDVAFVVKFARSYGRPPAEAFAAVGWITVEEADLRDVRVGIDQIPTAELSAEVTRRVLAAKLP